MIRTAVNHIIKLTVTYSSFSLSQMITTRQAFNTIIVIWDPISHKCKILYERPNNLQADGVHRAWQALLFIDKLIIPTDENHREVSSRIMQ